MPRLSSLLAILLATLAAAACEHGHEDAGPPTGALCPEDSTLSWLSFGKEFMESYCTRCHSTGLTGAERKGAPNDHNFDTPALVRLELEHIDQAAAAGPDAINTEMPIGAPTPTEDERRKLGEWLACGAP